MHCGNEGSPGLARGVVARNSVCLALPEGVAATPVQVYNPSGIGLYREVLWLTPETDPTGLALPFLTT